MDITNGGLGKCSLPSLHLPKVWIYREYLVDRVAHLFIRANRFLNSQHEHLCVTSENSMVGSHWKTLM